MARLFLTVVLLSLIGTVKLQQFGSGNAPNQSGLGGLLGGLLGGGAGGQMQQMGGQMPAQMMMPPQFGNMMNGNGNGQIQSLDQLLRNLPQQAMQIIQSLMNSLNGQQGAAFQNQFGQMDRNPMGAMNGRAFNGLNMPNPFAYGQQQQQQGAGGGLLGSLGRGGNPLGSLTSGLNLNGLTGQLSNTLGRIGLPLNGLTQGLQRTLSNVNL